MRINVIRYRTACLALITSLALIGPAHARQLRLRRMVVVRDSLLAGLDGIARPAQMDSAPAFEGPDRLADEEPGLQHYTAIEAARDTEVTPRLLADSSSPGLDIIDVDSHNGDVRVFGAAPSVEIQAAKEWSARRMGGMKHVVNKLKGALTPSPAP